MHPQYTLQDQARFWSKIQKTDGCWLWTAAIRRGGYGAFWHAGRHEPAHRVAYILTHGPVPEGLYVCHNCPTGDNPACCNPAHMFLGTHLDNSRDMIAKGRHAVHTPKPPPTKKSGRFGNQNAQSKLNTALAAEIRQRAATLSAYRLAAEYGVSPKAIYAVLRGETWR